MVSLCQVIQVGNLDFHKYSVQIGSFEWNFETFSSQVLTFLSLRNLNFTQKLKVMLT